MGEMCMQSDRKWVEDGMCGASKRSSSSAAYSQTVSGLAEGLSNYNITPIGDGLLKSSPSQAFSGGFRLSQLTIARDQVA
jgi:hypothetical protein